jgi:flagellar protein FliO/FliZ
MELMFGGMPDAGRFIIAFVLVLGLIGAGTLLWRRFGFGPLSPLGPRGRQARLAVIDAAALDARRRLVLIKRDNIEHLLMIGGPTDIVVESNITRTAATSREPRPIPESTSRHAASSDGADWTLPLEPPARTLRPTGELTTSVPEPPVRTAREAMVDSMQSVRSSLVRRSPASESGMSPEDKRESATPTPQPSPAEASHGAPPASEARRNPSLLEAQRLPAAAEPSSPTSDATESKRAAAIAPRAAPQSEDNSLTEMAQRLEAALRRPVKPTDSPAAAPAPARSPGRIEPPPSRKPHLDAVNAKASAKLPDQLSSPSPDLKVLSGKAKAEPPVESLEDEMAKMLGRSPAK